jgi:hypothetical protein
MDPKKLICLGMLFMIPFALLHSIHPTLSENALDAASGFFLTVSVGLMGLGTHRNLRRRAH